MGWANRVAYSASASIIRITLIFDLDMRRVLQYDIGEKKGRRGNTDFS